MTDREHDPVSIDEVEAEDAVSLPNKEVMSLLDVNANVDLGLNLAAPVDLAAAANLNVAAPIEASASANVLSPDAHSVSLAQQSGSISQTNSGNAEAIAPQQASVTQDSTGAAAGATDGATAPAAEPAAGTTSGGVQSLLNGGSLLDANVNIDANANLTAPVDGAVAANANVAAPIDASVSANVASPGAVSEAAAVQRVDISQSLDGANAHAEATQDATVNQK